MPPRPQPKDPDRPLSERERDLIQRLFRWEELPAGFKAVLTDHVSVNGSLHVSNMPTLKGEEWREVDATGQPAFTNSWVNYGSGFNTAAFYRDALGMVHLKGLVKSGTVGLSIFTLPVGYRPALICVFSDASNGAFGQVNVEADGDVILSAGLNVSASLDGISFRAA